MEFYDFNHISFIFSFSLIAVALLSSLIAKKIITSPQHDSFDHSIEGLRGFACLLVFVNHAPFVLLHNNISSSSMDLSPFSSFGNMGSFGVQIFFCITGYLFSRKIKECKFDNLFYIKRIKRLAPAYIFISTIILFVFIIQNHEKIVFKNDIFFIMMQIYSFGFYGSEISTKLISDTSLNSVIWTLPYEWKFYAIIPFISVCMKNKKSKILIIIFGCIVAASDFTFNATLWLYFVTGFSASYISNINLRLKNLLLPVIFISFLYILLSKSSIVSFDRFIATSIFFFSFILCRPKLFSIKSLSIIGTISYSVYLSHVMIMNILFRFFGTQLKFDLAGTWYLLSINILALIATITLSSLTYKYIESRYS